MANRTKKYCVKILYLKVKGQGHHRGQGHSKNKKCGKFDEMCGELKISISKYPYKFDIFGGLNHFLATAERWCSVCMRHACSAQAHTAGLKNCY